MEKRNTRQAILDEALTLFSVGGFEGVSVKEIASAVGIKDSSLYKHFKSKQEIFDILLEEVNQKFEETVSFYKLPQGEIEKIAKEYGSNDLVWLKKACEAIFLFFLKDPQASRFRRMLMIEQFKNNQAATTFRSWFADEAILFQTTLFAEMMEQGHFHKGPAHTVAMQFYAPFYMLLCLYDTMPGREDEAVSRLMEHVEQFASIYQIRKEGKK